MTNPISSFRTPIHSMLIGIFALTWGLVLQVMAIEKPVWNGGVMMGYTMGQNGAAWPSPLKDPLANSNRAGYYISQLRLKATIPFDSTFSAVFVGNAIYLDPQEAYLQKKWGQYNFKLGKFRGAGLKTGSAMDEFERTAVNAPRYARLQDFYLRTINFRDFGIQVERVNLDGNLQQRLYARNGNRQNIINDEPSWYENQAPAQVGGFDYSLDWKFSPYTTTGGHVGILADHELSEFVGTHDGWEAGYWFKTNPIVEGSYYHQMDFTKLHILTEGYMLMNRQVRIPPDSTAMQLWGVSSMLRLDHTERWGSFYRYEYLDPSDGAYGEDNLQMVTLGAIFKPSPKQYPDLKVTAQYVRTIEEGMRNLISNDNFFVQLQMMF